MKLIAHQGASLECPSNSLEGLITAARYGAFAVECDLQITGDGQYVIYHDPAVKVDGERILLRSLTLSELRELLAARGRGLMTLDEMLENYREDASVLLHMKLNPGRAVLERLKSSPIRFICGVQSLETAGLCRELFPSEQILAFMQDKHIYADFCNIGVGIIRIWERWLDEVTPEDVKREFPGTEVFIMSSDPVTGSMNGSPESLRRCLELGADGVLLNDIAMGVRALREM